MKKLILIISLLALVGVSFPVTYSMAQDEAPAVGELVTEDGEAAEASDGLRSATKKIVKMENSSGCTIQ